MNDTGVVRDTETVFRRLSDPFPMVSPEATATAWWVLTIGVLIVGALFVIWMYARDSRTCHWYVAVPLAVLRMLVYVLLAIAFLLPAKQTWETTEKTSRVLILLDVSPSMTQIADDRASAGAPKPATRVQKVLDFLTDDRVAFLQKIIDKNPVFVYRFGGRLDDETRTVNPETPVWTKAEWESWANYDFKPWVLRGLSKEARDAVEKMPAWKAETPGNAEWAIAWSKLPEGEVVPGSLTEDEKKALLDNRTKLDKRTDVARSIVLGTNVPDSITAAINREAANMVQGVIVFTDGRSNLGSAAAYNELKERAAREKIPVFTVAVGEPRENIAITITDLQAPDRAPPDEPFKVAVEVDGVGLERQEVEVKLGLFLPGKDPKSAATDHELTAKLTFQPGDPPHGQVEFVIDADQLPESMTEEAKKDDAKRAGKRKQLKQGAWSMVARVATDKREIYDKPEHVSSPRVVQVLESPMRILLWASGPTREYQTLRTLLMREVNEKRAELSIFLQNEGGHEGNITQDVTPDRLLIKFPTRYETTPKPTDKSEDKYLNLHEYDLILAFDPDWSELSAEQIENLRTWVVEGGGGFVYVGGPIHTYQLARADESGRLKPLLEMMCALPDDIILLKTRPIPRTPRRLKLTPNAEFDVLKLDDATDDPVAGWEKFFSGKDKFVSTANQRDLLNPKNGFYSYFPLKMTKPGAAVLMEFLDVNERGEGEPKPYFVINQPGRGRTAFLGSGEMWRTRMVDPTFFERFWIRLGRNISAARRNVQSFRGQVLVNKEYSSGSMVRVQTRLLAPNGKPYPPDAISPKFIVEAYDPDGTKRAKPIGPIQMAAKKGAAGFDGYYQAQVLADAKQFPPGEFRYKVVVDVPDSPGDTISGEFMVRRSDPELDNARPDFTALVNAASSLKDVEPKITEPGVLERLKGSATDTGKVKLAFKLAEKDKLELIPACLKSDRKEFRNRGAVEDLWDKGATLPSWATGGRVVTISYLLMAAIGLLTIEWSVRKLARLA
ncbi:vWA domain-containing protein [Limnoglobus roseus]|uniref:Putative Von Willebrand factor type A domain protein n=1 Tax=Limnoglobus roseus TaxID=2598579 RepID=A0A5C1A6L7_9BACT|nr:vWA domain-containing protein [Limnoglobus roseus]QEL14025.1 putative Von Willebrand factor type A domain protein [Limnoglobus roseus]